MPARRSGSQVSYLHGLDLFLASDSPSRQKKKQRKNNIEEETEQMAKKKDNFIDKLNVYKAQANDHKNI